MFKPEPFLLKCPNCGWSKMMYPESDVVDMSWGLEYFICPKCGTQTVREKSQDNSDSQNLLNKLSKVFK